MLLGDSPPYHATRLAASRGRPIAIDLAIWFVLALPAERGSER